MAIACEMDVTFASMKKRALFALAAAFVAFIARGAEFFSTSFESEEGYAVGSLGTLTRTPWRADRRPVNVTADTAYGGRQSLRIPPAEKFGQAHITSHVLARAQELYVDFWCRPPASEDDVEFLDFDGALVAFVRRDEQGEFLVFHSYDGKRGSWIATGQRFPLDSAGQSEGWLRLTLQRNFSVEKWSLFVNSKALFVSVSALPPDSGRERSVYFAGDEKGNLVIDDFYIGELNPFLTAFEVSESHESIGRSDGRKYPQSVGDYTTPARIGETPSPRGQISAALVEPRLKSWSLEGRQAGEIAIEKSVLELGDTGNHFKAFVPRRDEQGNPLPMEIVLTAEVDMKPGVDLRRLHWAVRHLPKALDGPSGEIIQTGTFSGALNRKVTVPGELVLQGLEVSVFLE